MVFHQHPGVDQTLALHSLIAEPVEESLPVLVIQEDWGPVDSPRHDRVQDTGNVEPGLPGHEKNLPKSRKTLKRNATYATTSPKLHGLRSIRKEVVGFWGCVSELSQPGGITKRVAFIQGYPGQRAMLFKK